MNIDLMYPGIVAFVLVLIGVVLTVIEFKRMEQETEQKKASRADQSKNQSQKQ